MPGIIGNSTGGKLMSKSPPRSPNMSKQGKNSTLMSSFTNSEQDTHHLWSKEMDKNYNLLDIVHRNKIQIRDNPEDNAKGTLTQPENENSGIRNLVSVNHLHT
jgi:hypothetical protein